MPTPSPSYTVTMRIRVLSPHPRATQHLVEAVADAGALVTGIDMVESVENSLTVLLTCDCVNTPHVNEVAPPYRDDGGERRLLRFLTQRLRLTTEARSPFP